MGRSSSKRKRQQAQQQATHNKNKSNNKKSKRKKKRDRFWVEDCQDTKIPEDRTADIDVLVTRVELEDSFWNAPDGPETTGPIGKSPKTHQTSAKGPDSGETRETSTKTDDPIGSPTTKETSDTSQEKQENSTESSTALVCVRKAENAKRPLQRFYEEENFQPLENGDCGDGVVNPFPKDEVADKFWAQRRRLFSRFDQGIKLDKESWFSVTPEAIADHIAARLVGLDENLTIIDPFCGVCGNAIAFAKRDEVKLVVCVDVDLEKLKKAAWNARVYDIPNDKIVFIHSDAYTILSQYNNGSILPSPSRKKDPESSPLIEKGYRIGQHELLPNKIDMVFLSPPWGGMDYLKVGKRNYDLKCIELDHAENKIDGEELLIVAAKAVGEGRPIAYFLPRNTNGIKLARSVLKAGCTGPVVMEQNVLNGKLKTITAYVGL